MKKLLALLAVVLAVVSCQTEPEGLDVNVGGEQTVTVNVTIPEAETRAANSGIGVFDNGVLDGAATMRYIFQVFYDDKESEAERMVKYSDGKSVAFDVRLVPGRDYTFVVWADVVTAEGADNHYNTTDLENITLNGEWNAMDETRDAFTTTATRTYNGEMDLTLKLTRPFAKLRVVTTDIQSLLDLGIKPAKATVTYTTDTKHRVAFNAVKGKAAAGSENKTHTEYTIAKYTNEWEENGESKGAMTLYTDYFFAENDVVKFEFKVYDQNGDLIKENAFNTDIYAKRNYLTTIKGNILTDGKNFTVTVEEEFAGELGKEDGKTFANVDTAEEFLDAINKGVENITLDGDIDLNDLLTAGTLSTRAGATLPFVIAEGKTLVLDLNGFKISAPFEEGSTEKHYYAFDNKGTFIVKDSKDGGQIIARGNFNYGTMTLESGTIDACDANGGYGVRNYDGATFVMKGGAIVTSYEDGDIPGDGYDATTLRIDEGATATINGGSINNISNYTLAIENYGTTTIKGGTFTSVHTTIGNHSTMTIDGGSFTCNGLEGITAHALWADAGTTTINGGTFDGKDNYNGFNVDAAEGAVVNINGGKFLPVHSGSLYGDGSIVVKGGEFFDDPTARVATGYKAELENGVYVVRKPQALIDFENAVANGEDVTLSEDLTLIDPVVVAEGKEVTINLNGKTLSGVFTKGAGAVITNNATLKVVGGTIKNTYTNGDAAINNSGELILEDVKIEGAPLADGDYSAYAVISSGKMIINDGTEVSADRGCLKLSNGGETIINGGTFVNNDIGSRSLTSHVVDVEDGGSNKLTINGGTFEHRHATTSGGVVICNRTKGTVYVNGGNFSGGNYYGNDNLSDYGYGGTFSVTGGTYTAAPATKYIAEGYKVIEENGKYNVVPDAVDDVVSSTETLEEAIAAGSDTIALSAGEYVIPAAAQGKTIKFVGTGAPEDTKVAVTKVGTGGENCDYGLDGSTVTFENITITTNSSTYIGYARCNGTYKNCIINGTYTLYGDSVFEDCTFNVSGDVYNIWTWGAKNISFERCTFNSDGKALLLYQEGTNNIKLNVATCIFNDNGALADLKAAIEIGDAPYGATPTYYVNVSDTKVNGYEINDKGIYTGTTLWANKNSMPAERLIVTVDGYTWVADGLSKKDGEYYVSNANGLAVLNNMMVNKTAGKGTVVNLSADINFVGKTWTPVDSHADTSFTLAELNGNGHTISNFTINGQAMFTRFAGSGDVTVKNITFDNATVTSNTINTSILTVQTYQNVLLDNVDVRNSSIKGGYKVAPLIATVYNENSSTITATLKNCDVENVTVKATSYDFCTTGMVAFVYAADNDTIEFENCTVKDVKLMAPNDSYKAHAAIYTTGSGSLYNEAEGVTVTNVTFEAL